MLFFTKVEEMSRVGSRDCPTRWRSKKAQNNFNLKLFQSGFYNHNIHRSERSCLLFIKVQQTSHDRQ